jgi:hypothetical protein
MNIIYNQKLRLEHMFFLKEVRSAILIKKKKKKDHCPRQSFFSHANTLRQLFWGNSTTGWNSENGSNLGIYVLLNWEMMSHLDPEQAFPMLMSRC